MVEPSVGPTDVTELRAVLDFEVFCAAESDRLTRALTLALGNRELGRDASAEAFARAWARWDKVSVYDNPTGWVYRVGLNWGRSRLRRWRREVTTDVFPDRVHVEASSDDTISAAMRNLSHDHRSVVVARLYLDWSEAEVATALDIPAGTVKSRLSRALAQLEPHLDAPLGG